MKARHLPLSYDELKMMHTKQLLNRRNYLYKLWHKGEFRNKRDIWDGEDDYEILYDADETTAIQEKVDIKTILATRPHIPNKKESKVIRQNKAKNQ